MRVSIQYFARYREALGLAGETVDSDLSLETVDDLRLQLLARGGNYLLLGEHHLMCARNEELCSLAEPLKDGDDVAFFPAVTGG